MGNRQNVIQKKKIYIHVASWHTRQFKRGIHPHISVRFLKRLQSVTAFNSNALYFKEKSRAQKLLLSVLGWKWAGFRFKQLVRESCHRLVFLQRLRRKAVKQRRQMRARRIFRALLTFFVYVHVLQGCLKSKVARQLKFISKLYREVCEFFNGFLLVMAGLQAPTKL